MKTISITALPVIGAALDGGVFAGLTTTKDGTHCAVCLLPEQGTNLNFNAAKAWAEGLDAELPSRPVAALLFANLRDKLRKRLHWTCEECEFDASSAWYCTVYGGGQSTTRKSYDGAAVAVRLIQLSA